MYMRKRLVDRLVGERNETIGEVVEIINNDKIKCNSCIVFIVFFLYFFTTDVGIGAYFTYYKYVNPNKEMTLAN